MHLKRKKRKKEPIFLEQLFKILILAFDVLIPYHLKIQTYAQHNNRDVCTKMKRFAHNLVHTPDIAPILVGYTKNSKFSIDNHIKEKLT